MKPSFRSAADTKSAAIHLLRMVLFASVTVALLSASPTRRSGPNCKSNNGVTFPILLEFTDYLILDAYRPQKETKRTLMPVRVSRIQLRSIPI
jgi:hypothetical protein